MFTTLIESTPHRQPNNGARIFSAVFHTALIAAAIYATASGKASDVVAAAASQVQKVTFVNTAKPAETAPAPKPKPKAKPVAPTKAPSKIPAIDPNAKPLEEPDAGATSTLPGSGIPGAYNPFEVDVEVVAIASSIRPQYPDFLRSSGTEGQVTAQFVVNEKGRVDQKTYKVISSSHKLFSDAVYRALSQMRFKPAQIAGKPVSQLVQQQFVFKLDR